MKRRLGLPMAITIAFVGGALYIAASANAGAGSEADDDWAVVIEQARSQAATLAFAGTVVVEWRDGSGRHRSELDVTQHAGVTSIEAERTLIADNSARLLDTGPAWKLLARGGATAQPELAAAKYQVVEEAGELVADRPTVMYEARRDEHVVVRVFVDDETGVVLKKETYDEDGEVMRAVWFTRFEELPARDASSSTMPVASGEPDTVDDFAAPIRDPGDVGDGFYLAGRWQHADGVAQLYYSDGVLGVSVFEQQGSLDWDEMLAGGEDVEVAGHPARSYALPVGEALVFERGGVVYTVVGDVPQGELVAAAADVSAPDDSALDRFTRSVLAPLRW